MSGSFACADFESARISRRSLLKVGGLGLMGMALPRAILSADRNTKLKARAKSVIFLHQWGGPSHVDTFDMKPSAPEAIRGEFKPIHTRTPGIICCDRLPRMATVLDRFAQVRLASARDEEPQLGRLLQLDRLRAADRRSTPPRFARSIPRLWLGRRSAGARQGSHADACGVPARHQRRLDHARPARQLPGKKLRSAADYPGPQCPDFRLPELSLPANLSPGRLENRETLDAYDRSSNRTAGVFGPGARARCHLRKSPDDAHLAQGEKGLRFGRGAGSSSRSLRPHHLRPELPAGPPAGGSGGPVHQRLFRAHIGGQQELGRLGHAWFRQQSHVSRF